MKSRHLQDAEDMKVVVNVEHESVLELAMLLRQLLEQVIHVALEVRDGLGHLVRAQVDVETMQSRQELGEPARHLCSDREVVS